MHPHTITERKCKKCGQSKPLSEFKATDSHGYKHLTCTSCRMAKVRRCRRCRQEKPRDQFRESAMYKGGFDRICMGCQMPTAELAATANAAEGRMVCRTCGTEKDRVEFMRRSRTGSFLAKQCASCSIDRTSLLAEAEAIGPQVKPTSKSCIACKIEKPIGEFEIARERPDWHTSKCRECIARRRKELMESPQCRKNRHWTITKTYGITVQQFEEMLAKQGNRCAICNCDLVFDETSGRQFHIDHDHKTGKIREILCRLCNVRLGHVESPGYLPKALAYLKKHGVDPLAVKGD